MAWHVLCELMNPRVRALVVRSAKAGGFLTGATEALTSFASRALGRKVHLTTTGIRKSVETWAANSDIQPSAKQAIADALKHTQAVASSHYVIKSPARVNAQVQSILARAESNEMDRNQRSIANAIPDEAAKKAIGVEPQQPQDDTARAIAPASAPPATSLAAKTRKATGSLPAPPPRAHAAAVPAAIQIEIEKEELAEARIPTEGDDGRRLNVVHHHHHHHYHPKPRSIAGVASPHQSPPRSPPPPPVRVPPLSLPRCTTTESPPYTLRESSRSYADLDDDKESDEQPKPVVFKRQKRVAWGETESGILLGFLATWPSDAGSSKQCDWAMASAKLRASGYKRSNVACKDRVRHLLKIRDEQAINLLPWGVRSRYE